jgi:hypothetical protein
MLTDGMMVAVLAGLWGLQKSIEGTGTDTRMRGDMCVDLAVA